MKDAGTENAKADGEAKPTEEELLVRLAESERTIAELRRRLWGYQLVASKTKVIANYLTMGPGLTRAVERWELAFNAGNGSLSERFPRKETMEVAAAYLRRRALSGLAIAALAIIPSALSLLLLWQQNKKIDLQILIASSAQARENQTEISLLATDIKKFSDTFCSGNSKATPLLDVVSKTERKRQEPSNWHMLLHECWSDQRTETPISRRNWLQDLRGFQPEKIETLEELNFGDTDGDNTYHSDLLPPDYLLGMALPLSRDLQQRVSTLAATLRPYRMLLDKAENDQSPQLTNNLYSPEKGSLLRVLGTHTLAVNALNAAQAWAPATQLTDLTWHRTSLANAMMECANFSGSVFSSADLSGGRFVLARFDYADLRQVSGWRNADFTYASFRGALLPEAKKLDVASLEGVDFNGAIVQSATWHKDLAPKLAADVQRADPDQKELIDYAYKPLMDPLSVDFRIQLWVMIRKDRKDWRPMRDAQCSRRVSEGFRID